MLGNGAFGYVFQAEDLSTQKKVAIKRIVKVGPYVSREFEVLSLLKGAKHCMQLENFFYTRDKEDKLIQNQVLEFCKKGELEQFIEKHGKLTLEQIKSFTYQIFQGCQEMHEKRIVHRDLKLENVLLTEDMTVKIADFGASKVIEEGSKQNTPYVVSRYYRAPELILAATGYGPEIDIWAVGCMLFNFVTG